MKHLQSLNLSTRGTHEARLREIEQRGCASPEELSWLIGVVRQLYFVIWHKYDLLKVLAERDALWLAVRAACDNFQAENDGAGPTGEQVNEWNRALAALGDFEWADPIDLTT